jgi:glycine cleavage system protein P-like pyridoxal-binding family
MRGYTGLGDDPPRMLRLRATATAHAGQTAAGASVAAAAAGASIVMVHCSPDALASVSCLRRRTAERVAAKKVVYPSTSEGGISNRPCAQDGGEGG